MRRILFVDDEPNVLHGLQRMLRSQRDEWEMSFAQGGDAALAMMAAAPFDVIVSDMRMSGMDGAMLLAQVRERFPEVIRIILSGHADMNAAFRAVPVAHQFLAKPCDSSTLRVAIARACGLQTVLNDDVLRRTVGSIRQLPALPRTYVALTEALESDDVSLDRVAKIVEQDVAIAAKILQLVNSAFFGLSRDVTNVRTAVSYLGIDILKSLVLSFGVFRAFENAELVQGFSVERFQDHAHLTAKIAAGLPTIKYLEDATALAALLHDVGKLILASEMPARFAEVLEIARERVQPVHEVEREILGVTHAELGAYLLGLWGLPWSVVEAVAHHHVPGRVPQQGLDALATVHIANLLALECAAAPAEDHGLALQTFDPAYVDLLGISELLPEWRTMAQDTYLKLRGACRA
ncbi:MAG TPA: response regulator [Terriglobia bacterium]|nr:response regulator [Terriglobia bacterium]